MNRTLFSFLLASLCLCGSAQAAKDILLRLQPAADAPVIAKLTASEKVILDTAPAPRNAALGWRQIALPTPFEGFVPVTTLSKNFEIVKGTPVHYLPTANAAQITRVEAGDIYEVVRVKEEWATVRFRKNIIGYFIDDSTEDVALAPSIRSGGFSRHLQQPDTAAEAAATERSAPAPAPAPVAIPAPPTRVNPDQPISQLDPNALPPENVVWQPARSGGFPGQSNVEGSRHSQTTNTAAEAAATPAPRISNPESRITDLIVSPDQTQAREATPDTRPAKAPRLLTGTLQRQLDKAGPNYPIRLRSPEGRLIAYVDLSGIYISDLSPYLDQKVYIRGQIYPLPDTPGQLVILAESLRLAE